PVTVTNPAPGGGTSTQTVNVTVSTPNPLPTTTTLNPTSALVGGAGFTLTVNGTGFVSGHSTVFFNGTSETTTFVSATQLTATIPAAAIATAGTFGVHVVTDPPGGGTSTPDLTFTVNNPLPTVTSLNPNSAPVGTQNNLTVTITGTGFVTGAMANFNGV